MRKKAALIIAMGLGCMAAMLIEMALESGVKSLLFVAAFSLAVAGMILHDAFSSKHSKGGE